MELIWGIQLSELILFLKQAGLATVGAAALWGFIFSIQDLRHKDSDKWILDDLLSMKIFNLFVGGIILSSVSYYTLIPTIRALAHDGISLSPSIPETIATFPLMSILFIVLLVLTFIMLVVQKHSEKRFSDLLTPFYAVAFVMAFVMTSFSGWRGVVDSTQTFYFIHGFHSIFTLGSVVVLDFLFVLCSRSDVLKQHIYKLFPTISKVIWIGLGLNFISGFLILDYFVIDEKFLFVQTVIAILVINGVLLAGPISRKMIDSVLNSTKDITAYWRKMGNIAGALSITSWIVISSVDFFENITLSYGELFIVYIVFFACAFIGHMLFEKIEKNKTPLSV